MAGIIVDESVRTLQTGFNPSSPTFLLQGEEFIPFGSSDWFVFEAFSPDSTFRPGETLGLVDVDLLGNFNANDVRSVTFVGTVDIIGDGFVDGLAVREGVTEFILTDRMSFLDYTPFSTTVTVSPQNYFLSSSFLPPTSEPVPTSPSNLPGANKPSQGGDILRGTPGTDRIDGLRGKDRIDGLNGNDVLKGGGGNDRLVGGGGNDRLFGDAGKDQLKGAGGNDKLFGGAGNDRLLGDAGKDVLKGGSGKDKLFGGGGNDKLFGEGGRDDLFGGGGKDTLFGGGQGDRLSGGKGADAFVFAKSDKRAVIRDFEERDVANLRKLNTEFSELEISQKGGRAIVEAGKLTIVLIGTDADSLDAGDFLF